MDLGVRTMRSRSGEARPRARGWFRPDGYGCYRRSESRFGFFLEYDRGTERPNHYAAKIATYYRYRDSVTTHRGDHVLAGTPPLPDGVAAYAPRRTVLDKVLVDAAVVAAAALDSAAYPGR